MVDVVCARSLGLPRPRPRASRKLSRLKILLRDWGIERVRASLEAELGRDLPAPGPRPARSKAATTLGVTPQRGSDLVSVGLLVPVGRITVTT